MTVLVTGGCGFIGSNFIRKILGAKTPPRVVNLDKLTYAGNLANLSDFDADPSYRFVHGDICDAALVKKLFREEGVENVVHFAAESHVDRSILGPAAFVQTNVVGTFTLLEAARESWLKSSSPSSSHRFLHVSTDEVYGSLGETGYFRELTPYAPRSPYSASKAASDHLASAYFHTYGLPVVITNCSNNYGPYQFPEKLIPLIIHNALNGHELPVYGDGKNVRDWLFVGDHCDALWLVLNEGEVGETYNIGGNNEKRNIDIVTTICNLLDEMVGPLEHGQSRTNLIRFVKDRPGHDRRYAIDASKISSSLGWSPRIAFHEGLRQTISWYLANEAWLLGIIDGSYREYYARQYEQKQTKDSP